MVAEGPAAEGPAAEGPAADSRPYTLANILLAISIKKGKRYVPEKEYIHMISSYITADWSNIE